MTGLIICAIIAGIATLYLIAPIRDKHPKSAYFLTLAIPACSLGILLMVSRDLPLPYTSVAIEQEDPYYNQARAIRAKLSQRPDTPELILELSGLQISTERYDEAIDLLSDAHGKAPLNQDFALQLATAHMAKGLLYAEKGQFDQAVKSLLQASVIAPEDAPFTPDIEVFIEQIEKMQAEKEKQAQTPAETNPSQDAPLSAE